MGDRALVIFTDAKGKEFSPVTYLHWHGPSVETWIRELAEQMEDRRNDVAYAAARFVGIAHTNIPGNLSLGMWNLPQDFCPNNLGALSHGDSGVFLVNCADFSWKHAA